MSRFSCVVGMMFPPTCMFDSGQVYQSDLWMIILHISSVWLSMHFHHLHATFERHVLNIFGWSSLPKNSVETDTSWPSLWFSAVRRRLLWCSLQGKHQSHGCDPCRETDPVAKSRCVPFPKKRWLFLEGGHTLSPIILLGQWLNFKLFGITYLVGKIKFKLFFPGSRTAKWVVMEVENCPKGKDTIIGDTPIFHFHDLWEEGYLKIPMKVGEVYVSFIYLRNICEVLVWRQSGVINYKGLPGVVFFTSVLGVSSLEI